MKNFALHNRHKCVCDMLQDIMQDAGFEECTYWLDIRLFCSVLACALGTYTVVRLKFPQDKDTLLPFVLLYTLIAAIVTYIDMWALGPANVYSLRDFDNHSVHVYDPKQWVGVILHQVFNTIILISERDLGFRHVMNLAGGKLISC